MLYIGDSEIKSVYFDTGKEEYWKDFTDSLWEVNTRNGWEVEMTPRKAIIKKFKIDTWGIRRTIRDNSFNIIDQFTSWKVNVSGLSYVNENVVTFGKAYYPTGGWMGYNDATSFAPGKFPNDSYKNCYYVGGLIIQAGGRYLDMADTYAYPSEQFMMHPWDVGNRVVINDGVITGTWFDPSYRTILIGLYGSLEGHLGEVYDISDHPIEIELIPDSVAPATLESWKYYLNNNVIIKPKTFENCWQKYNLVKSVGSEGKMHWSVCNNTNSRQVEIPIISDLDAINGEKTFTANKNWNYTKPWISFNYTAPNASFWTPIKNWFANNVFTNPVALAYRADNAPTLFSNSNITGEITLNIGDGTENNWDASTMIFTDVFYGSQIEKVNLNFTGKSQIRSALNAFRAARKLKEVSTNRAFMAIELAGAFEFCNVLEEIPANFFNYRYRSNLDLSNLCYTFEGCKVLKSIPKSSYAETVYDEENTIKTQTLTQAFNDCPALETIYPILDVCACDPNNTYKAFAGCNKLTHVLIKNLNKGDWRFDGTSTKQLGNLTLLDSESIKYMLNNVRDLAHLETDTETQNNSSSISFWNKEQIDEIYTQFSFTSSDFFTSCKYPVNTQIKIHPYSFNSDYEIYFLPQSAINSSNMENYRLTFVDDTATINSNGESNWGFYISPSSFKPNTIGYISFVTPYDRNSSSVTYANIYIPSTWTQYISQEDIDLCNYRGWKIYVGSEELTTV